MQISQIQSYTNTQYNKNITPSKTILKNQTDIVTFAGAKLEPETFTKKLKDIIDLIKTSFKETKARKIAEKQALIEAENKRLAKEEAKRAEILRKRKEMAEIAQKNLEQERKLRQQFDNQRIEGYKKLHPASLAKEYRRCVEQNDIVWTAKIKQILKDRGYALLDGKAVKEFSPKAYRPLEVLPYGDVPNSSYSARMLPNPPLVKSSDIMGLPTRGNYSLDNIGIYNFDITQKHYGQVRFPGTKFGANIGLEIPGVERGWTMTHSYRPNLKDCDKYHYCTALSYRHEENYLGQAPGFTFLIEGEIQPKELEELKNIFITNGLMEKLLKSAGNKEEATKTFQEMAEIIVNYLNKIN